MHDRAILVHGCAIAVLASFAGRAVPEYIQANAGVSFTGHWHEAQELGSEDTADWRRLEQPLPLPAPCLEPIGRDTVLQPECAPGTANNQVNIIRVFARNVLEPTEDLVFSAGPGTLTIQRDASGSMTFATNGKSETHRFGSTNAKVTTRWDGAVLVQLISANERDVNFSTAWTFS